MADTKEFREEFAGKPLTITVGKLAHQANGSVLIQYGETTVLATACLGGVTTKDYFPLTLDYEEKYYAAGKIKGSKWIKREGRPSEDAILTARVIDRALRPRFDHGIRNEVQVVATVLTFDHVNDPDMPALFAASLALMISDIPFDGPVASVRVGRVEGKMVFNPTYTERQQSDYDIIVAGTSQRINMLEAGAKMVAEDDMADAIGAGFKELQKLNALQKKIAAELGKPKQELNVFMHDAELTQKVRDIAEPLLEKNLYTPGKAAYYAGIDVSKKAVMEELEKAYADDDQKARKLMEADALFEGEIDRIVHKNIIEKEKRPDGRKLDELRALSVEVGTFPHTHGNGIFNRGETQALSVLTLAAPGLEQWMETMEIDLTKKGFMHHYNFPPFSVGETGRMGAPGRREIGHGALAERSLVPIIPARDQFPYTIRVVSEIMGSNGSSSMASVCASSLALMDGGVPIVAPAAGIAMGLMFDHKGEQYKILTDIQGPEDHHGDMDLKVAGTADGVTGMQMDVKIEGITEEIVRKTLIQAKKARLEILAVMTAAIAAPRSELSPHAPRVQTMHIEPSKIGAVIGKGGETINGIIEETGATIDIEDDGTVFITCVSPEGMAKAVERINQLTYEPKPGEEFDGEVTGIKDFGIFVEILPGKEGMVHVSEMSTERVNHPRDVVKEGQQVHVWVKAISDEGKISLSMVGPHGKQFSPRPGGDQPRRPFGERPRPPHHE